MELSQRIKAFAALGDVIKALPPETQVMLENRCSQQNAWFTPASVALALKGVAHLLNEQALREWTSRYHLQPSTSKVVGIAMAGNIPLVGFHDLLCTLMAGHKAKIKLSSQDSVLMEFCIAKLLEIAPEFENSIIVADHLKNIDAVIATGSDNTSRYFEYYFRNIPNIIRKNRSSCAIIMGEEPASELEKLGNDIFTYFGLGCRNVSKLYVPEGYSLSKLLDAWQPFSGIVHHHKYANNYDYQKSILLVNRTPFFDSHFVMLTESTALVSPISVVFYETYADQEDLRRKIENQSEKLQCIVSANKWYIGSVDFGKAQFPDVWDYADDIDTMRFLQDLT